MVELAKLRHRLRPPRDGRAGRIRLCGIKITDLCNLRCHTCGQWGESGHLRGTLPRELAARELPKDRWAFLLRDLVRHGHRPNVYFWGGEPLLYEGLPELIEETARLGLPASIATNGTRLAALAEPLVAPPAFLVQVSVDGPDAATHNACRPAADPGHDSFASVVEGLRELRAVRRARRQALPLLVTLTTISERNAGRLLEVYETFRGLADALVFYLGWWIDAEAAERHQADFRARFGQDPRLHRGYLGNWRPSQPEELARELRALRARARGDTPLVVVPNLGRDSDLTAYYSRHGERFGFDRCVSVFSAIEVLANGDVSPCRDYADYVVGNARERTLSELWNSERYLGFRQSLLERGLMPVCSRCCGLMGN